VALPFQRLAAVFKRLLRQKALENRMDIAVAVLPVTPDLLRFPLALTGQILMIWPTLNNQTRLQMCGVSRKNNHNT
jgi:hypothetical protein